MDKNKEFREEVRKNTATYTENESLQKAAQNFLEETIKARYSYNFSWMGRPVIQYPQDIVAMQELVWDIKPDLIIETGIAHGGSLIMYAGFLEMMGGDGHVLGIDIDIREHNKKEIEEHPMFKRITMFEGSSIADDMVAKVKEFAKDYKTIMLVLDSNHTHDHVLAELRKYADLVSVGSYAIVFDTVVENLPEGTFDDREWSKDKNPKTAVWEFMKENDNFMIDKEFENKLLITVAPDGYLKRIK